MTAPEESAVSYGNECCTLVLLLVAQKGNENVEPDHQPRMLGFSTKDSGHFLGMCPLAPITIAPATVTEN